MSRGPKRRTLNIGHRGAASLWPENTLPAFKSALAAGCDGLELDVQITADGEAVIHHNYRLVPDFTRGASGAWLLGKQPLIANLNKADISECRIGIARAGSAYGREHPDTTWVDTHVPTLDEALALFVAHASADSLLLLELKHPTGKRGYKTTPDRLIRAVISALDKAQVDDRVVVVGFNWQTLLAFRRTRPSTRIWFTTYPQSWFQPSGKPSIPPSPRKLASLRRSYSRNPQWMGGFWPGGFQNSAPRAIASAAVEGWLAYGPDTSREDVLEAQALGLRIGVWGVNDVETMRRFIALDVEAICTDRPDRLALEQERSWTP